MSPREETKSSKPMSVRVRGILDRAETPKGRSPSAVDPEFEALMTRYEETAKVREYSVDIPNRL